MKNWRIYVKAGAWSALVLLLIPPLWYSLRTPFALIDDYGVWLIFQSVTHLSGIIQWCHDTFLHPQDRFRIIFDIYTMVTWALLGENSALHHAMRWVLKTIVVWSTFKILRLMTPAGRSATGLPFGVFCVIFIFFPNNPEARLVPQEMLTVTFLALLLYEIACLYVHARGDLAMLSRRRYLWLIFVFTAMLWAKEPNIVLGMVILMSLACLNLKRWIRLLPFVVVVLLTGLRVWVQSHTEGYGTAPMTLGLIYHNIDFHGRSLLLAKAGMAGLLLLAVGTLGLQTWKTRSRLDAHPVLIFSWLVCLNTLAFSASFFFMWHLVLRYFYPVVYLMALWIGLALLELEAFSFRWRLAVAGFTIAASIYFIGVNYYNFVYQFANQYYTRVAEQDILRNVDQLLRDGKTVTLTKDEEYEYNIEYYFNSYLPYYKHTAYRVHIGPITTHGDDCYYVTRNERLLAAGHQWYRHIDNSHVSRILSWCDRISTWFGFGHPALKWRDLGADWIGRHGEEIPGWYIYRCRDIWDHSK